MRDSVFDVVMSCHSAFSFRPCTMKHNQTEHRNNNNNSKLRMLYNCNAFLSFCYELIMCIHVNVYFYWMLLYNDVSETLLISVISYICINMYLSIFA